MTNNHCSERPWLADSYDEFERKFFDQPYRCAVVFVDNSGADFILGVIPFARELSRHGTKVVLCIGSSNMFFSLGYCSIKSFSCS